MTTAIARSRTTRVIHLLLLSSVIAQLTTSQFMRRPFPGETPAATYTWHEYVGLGSLGIVGAFWLWTMIRHGETRLGRLLPWLSSAGRSAVFGDAAAQLRLMARLKAPGDEDGALASAVHGLGLLVVTAMAVTGTVYYFGPHSLIGRPALTLHKVLANLTWAYLIGHAGLALLHHLLGSDIFSRMFWKRGQSLGASRPGR